MSHFDSEKYSGGLDSLDTWEYHHGMSGEGPYPYRPLFNHEVNLEDRDIEMDIFEEILSYL